SLLAFHTIFICISLNLSVRNVQKIFHQNPLVPAGTLFLSATYVPAGNMHILSGTKRICSPVFQTVLHIPVISSFFFTAAHYISFLKSSFRSSTLASFGLPGAQASACADSARN